MPEAQAETTYVNNLFGLVTDKRVVYHRDRGWLWEGSEEDVPLRHVASVWVETSRNIIGGIMLILIGLATLIFMIGALPVVFGALLLWGSPTVVVNTTDGNREVMQGWPWHRGLADDFARALQGQIVKE